MRRPAPFAPPKPPGAARTAPRTRIAAALALVRCEVERERLARERDHLACRAVATDAARARNSALGRDLRERLAPEPTAPNPETDP